MFISAQKTIETRFHDFFCDELWREDEKKSCRL